MIEIINLAHDDVQMLVALGRDIAGDIVDHFGICLDHRQRRLDVMRDVGDQIPPQLVNLAQLVRGIVQRIRQLVDLAEIAAFKMNIVMPLGQLVGGVLHLHDRPRQLCRYKQRNHNR